MGYKMYDMDDFKAQKNLSHKQSVLLNDPLYLFFSQNSEILFYSE